MRAILHQGVKQIPRGRQPAIDLAHSCRPECRTTPILSVFVREPLNKYLKRTSLPPSRGKDRMGVSCIKGLRFCTPTLTLPLQGGGGLNQRFLSENHMTFRLLRWYG